MCRSILLCSERRTNMEEGNRTSKKQKNMEDDDRISMLEDTILCHILNFLPSKQAFATRVLSKRWKFVCRWSSLQVIDFEDSNHPKSKKAVSRFLHALDRGMLTVDFNLPLQKFRLCCGSPDSYNPKAAAGWLRIAVFRKIQHLDLSVGFHYFVTKELTNIQPTDLSPVFRCTTLVVLKLNRIHMQPFSSVDLPLLRVLHLQDLIFPKRDSLALLLSGSPNLEDFKARGLCFDNYVTHRAAPKLVRADISAPEISFSLTKVISNVQFLRLDKIYCRLKELDHDYSFPFHNLTHIELVYKRYNRDWSQVVKLLHHCPKLQDLVINQPDIHDYVFEHIEHKGAWKFPLRVPECILLHLKRCYLNDYRGTESEFEFARYIMQNGRFLDSMTISSGIVAEKLKFEMLNQLSSSKRGSATCRLFFK